MASLGLGEWVGKEAFSPVRPALLGMTLGSISLDHPFLTVSSSLYPGVALRPSLGS